ncbi:uncharacterized protein LOC114353628 [Ostrinia furnacalis]|uniref:uncharacterized protein LOC114353628 n=1 Tax=Ostrinia furnacalis TaxID=93504 RepID=UPI001040B59D|nr:uncharacterized protein LOC114353628 [Ostrinia furnacalis]
MTVKLWILLLPTILCHIPNYITTPPNKIDQFCNLADTCVHDTIPVCGRMGDEKRSFLDLCDMLEFACDTNQVYTHIDDTDDCPVHKSKH